MDHLAGCLQKFKRGHFDWYKGTGSVLMGLIGFFGSFYAISFEFDTVKIHIPWSLMFPLLITLAWGLRYGLASIILGFTVLYPFYLGSYNGWASFVSAFSLILWIVIQGSGADRRLRGNSLYTNVYFLQFVYAVIRVILYFTAFPFLYRFNPPFWQTDAHTSIAFAAIVVFAAKSVLTEYLLVALCDVILMMPFVKKILRLNNQKVSRYNDGIILGLFALGEFFSLTLLTVNYYIIDPRHSFQWLSHPSSKILTILLFTGILNVILGGIIARFLESRLTTEELLRQSEAKFRGLFENLNDLFIETSLDGKIINVAPSAAAILKYSQEDLIGMNLADLYCQPEQRQDIIQMLVREKEILNYEITMRDKEGKSHYLSLHAKVVGYNQEEQRIIGIARDITEIRKLESNLEAIVESTDDLIWSVDREFRYKTFNTALRTHLKDYYGIDLKQGLHPTEVFPHDYANRWLGYYERVIEDGKFRVELLTLKGSAYLEVSFNPIFKDGEVSEIAVFAKSITERKKTEEELKRMTANLQAIIESTDDHIWLVDRNFAYAFANTPYKNHIKKYFGVNIITGIRCEDIFSPDYAAQWNGFYERAVREGKYKMEFLTTKGDTFLELSFNPIYKDGEMIAVSVFGKDITNYKRAEQQILKLNAELEDRVKDRTAELQSAVSELESFAYTVSHDLKSPLRAIDGYSRIIEDDYGETLDGDAREMIGYIRNICRDMFSMINKLLQYSTTSRSSINKEQINIGEMFGSIYNELKASHPERDIELVFQTNLPEVLADRVLLRQAIYNILANAVKFTQTRAKTVINVGSSISGNEHIFYIEDNGVGFDMAYAGKIFGIFQRLHGADEFEGSGIGLATVKKVIQKHGGRTWIEGAVDKGATVYFSLPIRENSFKTGR